MHSSSSRSGRSPSRAVREAVPEHPARRVVLLDGEAARYRSSSPCHDVEDALARDDVEVHRGGEDLDRKMVLNWNVRSKGSWLRGRGRP